MSHSDSPLTATGLGLNDVDRSQESYRPSPYPPRTVPPSGDVSRDGTRAWPRPSLTSRILVWGGVGIAAAAATAGTVMAVRAVVDGIAGSDEDDAVEAARERARRRAKSGGRSGGGMPRNAYAPRPRPGAMPPGLSPRFADVPGGDDRDEERARAERRRAAAARSRAQSDTGMLDSVNGTIQDMTSGVRHLLDTVNAAINGFRSVANQAGGIMEEFRNAADTVKSALDTGSSRTASASRPGDDPYKRPARHDMVDLRGPVGDVDDPRTHRL